MEVVGIEQTATSVRLSTTRGPFEATFAVNCAGLFSDRLARMAGADPGLLIVPFRGEYYELTPEASDLCRALIYPVPDPELPFLGIHFTRSIHGGVHCGPNAVLAFRREGYQRWDVSLRDLAEIARFPGLRRVGRWRTAIGELTRSLSKRVFVRSARKLIPEIEARHLRRAPSGVRAQAVSADGALVDDFVLSRVGRVLNVLNAPSPGATAALAIADRILEEIENQRVQSK